MSLDRDRTIKDKVRLIGNKTSLTIEQIAEIVGCSKSYLSAMINPPVGSEKIRDGIDRLVDFALENRIASREENYIYVRLRDKLKTSLKDKDFVVARKIINEMADRGEK